MELDAVRKLILDRLLELRLTMSEASRKIGMNHSYLQQFLKRGTPRELKENERGRLADLLGVHEDQLRGKSAPLPKREYLKLAGTGAVQQRASDMSAIRQNNVDNLRSAEQLYGNLDLPVFGTSQGGNGALIVTDRPVDWVARPASLLKVVDGYGMIVTGNSMAPEHKNGSIALVNPHLPPKAGDSCIFRSHNDDGSVRIVIKELRSETDLVWKVHQHNPKKDFTLKKSEWQVCHKTVGNYFA